METRTVKQSEAGEREEQRTRFVERTFRLGAMVFGCFFLFFSLVYLLEFRFVDFFAGLVAGFLLLWIAFRGLGGEKREIPVVARIAAGAK